MPPPTLPSPKTALPRLRLNLFLTFILFFLLRLDLYRWVKRSFVSIVVTVWNTLDGDARRRKVEGIIGWVEIILYLPLLLNILESIYLLISTSAPVITPSGPVSVDSNTSNNQGGTAKARDSPGMLVASRAESPALHRFLPSSDSHPPLSSSPSSSSLRSRASGSASVRGSDSESKNQNTSSPSTPQRQMLGGNGNGMRMSGSGSGTKSVLGQGMGTRPLIGGSVGGGGGYGSNTPSRLGVGSSVTFALADNTTNTNAIGSSSTTNNTQSDPAITSSTPTIAPGPQTLSQSQFMSARQILAQSQSRSQTTYDRPASPFGESPVDLGGSMSASTRSRFRSSLPASGLGSASGDGDRKGGSTINSAGVGPGGAAAGSIPTEEELGGIDPLMWSTFEVRHHTPNKSVSGSGFGFGAGRASPGGGGVVGV